VFPSTLAHLQCPSCGSQLELEGAKPTVPAKAAADVSCKDVLFGKLACKRCPGRYPILAGVAIVVPDVRGYLLEHVKGISRQVTDAQIPSEHRQAFARARKEIAHEHIEDDLEAERVNALYVMTHYLHASGAEPKWWQPLVGVGSPAIDAIVRQYWDQGPTSQIVETLSKRKSAGSLVELGCGSGGLYAALAGVIEDYLGIDSSFASIALARHLALGAPFTGEVLFPEDLLAGPVSRALKLPRPPRRKGQADFVVCDVQHPPLKPARWDLSAALNLIDMMEDPSELPALQARLLREDGLAIQSCPYIWHPGVAAGLRKMAPKKVRDSASAVEWLYERAGFEVKSRLAHVPWLFFKHVRQLEIYSVHLFFAGKK
jgi:SAM-dependent methyltransferase